MQWTDRIGRRLKLRDLHILLAVVQYGSMTKAAHQLAVSNPVVSKAIADMEHALSVRLLDRTPQGIEPTVYGRALLDRGLIAFDELRQAVKHIEFLSNPTAGEVRIGTSIALAEGFVSHVVDRLYRRYPRIAFQVMSAESATIYRALEDRKVDLVIARIFSPIAAEHMSAELLYEEPQVVVAAVKNPWTRRRKVELAELMQESWVLPPPDTLSGTVIVEAFRAKGLEPPRSAIIAGTVPVRTSLVATGRFLTIAPDSVLKIPVGRQALKRLPIDLPSARRPIGVVTLKNRTISPVAQLFIDSTRKFTAQWVQ